MLRFTIRDVLWLTVVMGLSIGLCLDKRAKWGTAREREAVRLHANELRDALSLAHAYYLAMRKNEGEPRAPAGFVRMDVIGWEHIDWELVNKPIP
jgi:hypothetical protein